MSGTLIVGISGVTNGGKSTLIRNISKVLPNSRVLYQDNYFLSEDSPLHVPSPGGIKHHNWDIISSINMEKMIEDVNIITGKLKSPQASVKKLQPLFDGNSYNESYTVLNESCMKNVIRLLGELNKEKLILLIDGFLIYDDCKLAEMCDLKFFVTLPKDQCIVRRNERVYDPPDPPGYFEACVWPMYMEYLSRATKQYTDLIVIDGRNSRESILLPVLEKIVSMSRI